MHQLVYISTMRNPVDETALHAILDSSRRNNARAGVTGLLLVGSNRFLQALEGPTGAVLDTYQRIRSDDRHFACVLLSSQSISRRAFGDWAMAAQQASCVSDSSLSEIVEALTNDLADLNLQAQLRGFARLHDAA